jgi:hypothetical protein
MLGRRDMSTKREVIDTWFRRVWKEEDAAAIDEMLIVDGGVRGLGANSLVGPKDFKVFHATVRALLSGIVTTVDKSIEEGDWLSCICTVKAKSRKTGAPVAMTGSVLVKVVNGKITEAYNHFDFLGLFGQLGLLPGNALQTGLAGERIV